MATKKVTVTLDELDLARVKSMVAEGSVSSVSGFVQHAVAVALSDAEVWDESFEQWLASTGGAITAEERSIADALLDAPLNPGIP